MSGEFNWKVEARWALLLVGSVAAAGVAGAQAVVPDAQVEANVLKALAGAPDLANESIETRTVYGTVTLSGTVKSEQARTEAENLAANANGVKKVVDQLQLGAAVAETPAPSGPPAGMVLLSDGTYGPDPNAAGGGVPASGANPAPGSAPAAMAQRNNPDADQALDRQMEQQNPAGANPGQPGSAQPAPAQPTTATNTVPVAPARRPLYAPGYPQYPYGYPPAGGYAGQGGQQPPMGGQVAGQSVTIPAGALLRVRVNRTLSSSRTTPGTTFDGIVVNDVVANGFVAIPRGAAVQGKVIDVSSSGALKGRGQMSIQLTSVTLGGKSYALQSDVWARNGNDKTIETVNKTAGGGVLGALLGAAVGGGRGAAIGAGVGAAAGVGSSAASGNGEVFIPAESLVTFHTAGLRGSGGGRTASGAAGVSGLSRLLSRLLSGSRLSLPADCVSESVMLGLEQMARSSAASSPFACQRSLPSERSRIRPRSAARKSYSGRCVSGDQRTSLKMRFSSAPVNSLTRKNCRSMVPPLR